MRPECAQAAANAMGKPLTEAQGRDFEQRIASAMRNLARQDPESWRQAPQHERLQMAAEEAAKAVVGEKQLKQQREAQKLLAVSRITAYVEDAKARGLTGLDALSRVIAFSADGKSNFQSIEIQAKAIRDIAFSHMIETLEASNPKFFGLLENQEGITALVKELFGEDSGKPEAKKGAAEFHKVAEELRQRFNRAGGDIGNLESWAIPQHHSQVRVAKAGADKWLADTLPKINREAYYNEDGTRMSDAQLSEFLKHAYQTIATGGANKVEPGAFQGNGARANRGNASRQIHFKDAQSYLDYQRDYGERTLYEVMTHHIDGLSKDVAHVETLGPNPDATFRFLKDKEAQEAILANPAKLGKVKKQAISVENLYNSVAGRTDPVADEHLAKSFDTLRQWLMASRLGSAVISSFSDEATLHITGRLNNLPPMQLFRNEVAALNPANRMEERMAQRAGLGLQTLVASLNRFGQEGLGRSFSSKLANITMRAQGLNAMTEARRRAWGVTHMSAIGSVVKGHARLSTIDAVDNRILLSKGITDTDFQVWKKAELEDWGGGNKTMLTPESIYRIPDAELSALGDPQVLREQAVTKLLGSVLEEQDMAVVEPGARDRQITGSNSPRGTWKGELTRSFFLFKSFPFAMINRHWQRGFSLPNAGGKAAYIATMLAATTVAGMASLQVSEMLAGRDPRNMSVYQKGGARNWIAAMLKGGSLGIYGDFLFSDTTQHGNSPLSTISGPVAGMAEDTLNLTQGSIAKSIEGKDTHAGANAVRFVKGNTPFASLWYAKAALDHLIFNRLQEYFSPGYLAAVRNRSRNLYGQSYWWDPASPTPQREPNLVAAAGK